MKKIEILVFLFLILGAYSAYSQEAKENAPGNKAEQMGPELKTASQTPIIEAAGEIQTGHVGSLPTGQRIADKGTAHSALKTAASDPDPVTISTTPEVVRTTQTPVRSSEVNAANSHLNGTKPE